MSLEAKPCVGCGYCCTQGPCAIATRRYGRQWQSPCPLLVEHDGRHWCAAIEQAEGQHRMDLMKDLAINAGCSSTLFNAMREEQIRRSREHAGRNCAIEGTQCGTADGADAIP